MAEAASKFAIAKIEDLDEQIIAEGKPKDILKSTKARELYFGSFEN